jgi:hypothetical protein
MNETSRFRSGVLVCVLDESAPWYWDLKWRLGYQPLMVDVCGVCNYRLEGKTEVFGENVPQCQCV